MATYKLNKTVKNKNTRAGSSIKKKTTSKTSKVKKTAKAGGSILKNIASGLEEKYIGSNLVETYTAGKSATKTNITQSTTTKHHRKGKVPKTVKKWARKIVTRRKAEEKIVKDLFGAGGGKIIKKAKERGSIGVITPQERAIALSR